MREDHGDRFQLAPGPWPIYFPGFAGKVGQPILFYTARKDKQTKSSSLQEPNHEKLAATLKGIGLAVSPTRIGEVVKILYPDKLPDNPVEGKVIRDLFLHFEQRL